MSFGIGNESLNTCVHANDVTGWGPYVTLGLLLRKAEQVQDLRVGTFSPIHPTRGQAWS